MDGFRASFHKLLLVRHHHRENDVFLFVFRRWLLLYLDSHGGCLAFRLSLVVLLVVTAGLRVELLLISIL